MSFEEQGAWHLERMRAQRQEDTLMQPPIPFKDAPMDDPSDEIDEAEDLGSEYPAPPNSQPQDSQGSRASRSTAPIAPTMGPVGLPPPPPDAIEFGSLEVPLLDPLFKEKNIKRISSAVDHVTQHHLIRRCFPLIGVGKWTLVFLLAKDRVAKVPRYEGGEGLERFRAERTRDLGMCQVYPFAFAPTRQLPFVFNDDLGLYVEELFVQDLLRPPFYDVRTLTQKIIDDAPNKHQIHEMRRNNPTAHQFGTFTDPLTGGEMLLCFDYE